MPDKTKDFPVVIEARKVAAAQGEHYKEMMNYGNRPTVPCELCGMPTPMTGTRRCDSCYEVERWVTAFPKLARQILDKLEAR